jgi:hypothetical protein
LLLKKVQKDAFFSNLCHRLVIRGRLFAARNAVFGLVSSFENCPDACARAFLVKIVLMARPEPVLEREAISTPKRQSPFFLSFLEQSNA